MKGNVTLEQTQELHLFLQGENPEGYIVKPLNIEAKKAFTIIWFLQEHLGLIPDTYEMCSQCGKIYDSSYGGSRIYCKNYCDWCDSFAWPDIDEWEYGSCEGCSDEGLCPFNDDNRNLVYFSNIFAEICEDNDRENP